MKLQNVSRKGKPNLYLLFSNSRCQVSVRRKQKLVILSLVLTVEPGEKVPGENKLWLVFAFLLPGEKA